MLRQISRVSCTAVGLIALCAVPASIAQAPIGSERPITSWVQSDGPHVAYGDANGNVYQLWYTIATGRWASQSLMTVPNAAPVGSRMPMTSWQQSDGPHVAYADTNGNIHQFWYTLKTGQWFAQSLATVPNAVAVGPGMPMTSWIQSDGPHVAYADAYGNIHQLWYTLTTGQWSAQSLATVSYAVAVGSGMPMTSWLQSDGPHVAYGDAYGNIRQLWYTVTPGYWSAQSLATVPNAVAVGSGRPMTSWIQSDGPHVAYADTNGNIHQLWYTLRTGQWFAQNLANVPNAVAVGSGRPMTSWIQSDGPHVAYGDAYGNIHQLWYTVTPGYWSAQSLMTVPNAADVGFTMPMTSWVQSDGPHVVYGDTYGNIHQLWYTLATGQWAAQIL